MNLVEYCDFVQGLASKDSTNNIREKMATAGLGLSAESGEVTDIVKKILFHGKEWDEEAKLDFKKELGDVLWYIAFASRFVLECPMQELIDLNVEKLKGRYKTGKFSKKEFKQKEKEKNLKK